MKRALVFLIVIAAGSAAADSPKHKPVAKKPAAPPTTATITVGSEAPRPKVLVVHPRDGRKVTGRPKMDDRLDGLPRHLPEH
ncbi:MAG TPA: hypothetical protein VL463_28870 [Kofleriaceae bacterium]|jgi:hypothetical protein|nr:hypothetical protein [Kofleriaceae bacterium]